LEDLLKLESYELAFHFIPPGRMATINQQYLDHEGSTDVITFDYREGYGSEASLAGEIFISIADAVAQAKTFQRPWEEEVVRYMVHGVLHLRGYNDLEPAARRKMKATENRLLGKLMPALS
jgi:probable rRNA maturation factor